MWKRSKYFSIILSLLILVSCFSIANAKSNKGGKGDGSHQKANCEERADSEKGEKGFLGAFCAWRITEALDLPEDVSVKLTLRIKKLDELRRDFAENGRKMVDELDDMVNEVKADTKKIAEKLNELKKMKSEFQKKEEELQNKVEELLTVEQQAKLIVLQKRLRKEIREAVGRAKRFTKEKGNWGKAEEMPEENPEEMP